MHFRGQHNYVLDHKNRLAIPSALRECMDERLHGSAFIALPGPNDRLWLWPEKIFEQWVSQRESSLLAEEEVLDFERLIFSQSAKLPMDGSGRVRLPDWMTTRFRLSGPIVIIGNKDHLELYPPTEWQAEQERLVPATADLYRRARPAFRAGERRSSEGGT